MEENKSNQKLNVDTILPFGDNLRPLIGTPSSLSDSELKNFLAQKGIFVSSTNREITVPLITMGLLSPLEFEVLREKQKDKEASIKRRNREMKWTSDKTLLASMKGVQIPIADLIPKRSSNYEIKSFEKFKPVDGNQNHLIASYEIERTDRTKDWVAQHSVHKGVIELQLTEDKKVLKVAMEHTADETHDVNEKSVKYIKDFLAQNSYVSNEKPKRITFGDFDNSSRVKFLLNLLNDVLDESDTFKFKQITDVDISIDTNQTLPDKIKWMESKVSNMKFKGQLLHETDLLKDPEFHSSLIFSGVKASYVFESAASKGTCTFEFGFPSKGNIPTADSEFIYRLSNFTYESENKTKKKVQGFLYAKFDEFKSKAFEVASQKTKKIRRKTAKVTKKSS
jgi:hypothetical protein